MKTYITSFSILVCLISGSFVTLTFASEANMTITSVNAIVSNQGYISNAGKANITVGGTAPGGSTVTVTLTDSTNPANSISNTQMIPAGSTSYLVSLNGTLAYPQPLHDGLIHVSAYSATSSYTSTFGTPATTTIMQETVSPTIYIIGDDPFKCRIRMVCLDLGVVALDSFGNKLIATSSSNVRTNLEGNYTIKYRTTDFAGNEAAAVRKVAVSGRTSGLSTTTPDLSNIPTGIATTTVSVPVESIPSSVEPTLTIESIPVIKTSGIAETIKRQLLIGTRGEDVKLLQTLFSKDQSIYPEGLISGYFGSLTQKAVQKFQEKYEVASKGGAGYGQVGPKTKAKLIELFGM